jgi:hypothetical protein
MGSNHALYRRLAYGTLFAGYAASLDNNVLSVGFIRKSKKRKTDLI